MTSLGPVRTLEGPEEPGRPRPLEPAHLPIRPRPEELAMGLLRLESEVRAQRLAHPGKRLNQVSLLVSTNHLDRVLAALNIAIGAASMDIDARLFFTFWGVSALCNDGRGTDRSWFQRVRDYFVPRGCGRLPLSQMSVYGAGTRLMRRRMRQKGLPDAAELLEMAAAAGVQIHVCEMSMDMFGFERSDLIDYPGLELCGVGAFLGHAMDSSTTLFV